MEGGMTCKTSSPQRDPIGDYQTHLDHLIAMAKVEGFKAYAWKRAQAMDTDASGLWTGIADDLLAAMAASTDGQAKG